MLLRAKWFDSFSADAHGNLQHGAAAHGKTVEVTSPLAVPCCGLLLQESALRAGAESVELMLLDSAEHVGAQTHVGED